MKDNLIVFDAMQTMIMMVMVMIPLLVTMANGITLLVVVFFAGLVLPLLSHLMVIGILVVLPTPILVSTIIGIVMKAISLFLRTLF